jgi:hypothetical protein
MPFSAAAAERKRQRGDLAAEGMEKVLLVRVINHGLSGLDGHNSPLGYNVALQVTLIRMSDYTQVSGFYATYESPARKKFVDWAVNDAQPFRAEVANALQNLSDVIATELGSRLPPAPAPPIGFAQAKTK